MKRLLSILGLFLASHSCWSQISTVSSTTPSAMTTLQTNTIIQPPPLPNTVAFDFDETGNQIKRRFIYIASGVYRQSNSSIAQEVITEEKLIQSDIYSDILYYPNPVQSELFLKWKNNQTDFVSKIEVYSLSGQRVFTLTNMQNTQETTIDFQSLPNGYYSLLLLYNSGEAKELKVIKK